MRPFLRNFFFYTLSVIGLYALLSVLVFSLVETPVTSYNAAAVDKKARLMELDSPKIVLVAGSNFAFGIDSELIETQTGYPVVNLGLHAGVGYKFYAEMAKNNLNEGDIVVIGFEYDLYNGLMDIESVLHTLEIDWTLAQDLAPETWATVAAGFPQYTFNRAINTLLGKRLTYEGVYSRASFNAYGDIAVDRPTNIMTNAARDAWVTIDPSLVTTHFINYFKAYKTYVEAKGATLVFTFASLDELNLDPNSDIDGFVDQLKPLGIPLLHTPQELVYPDAYFYDTHYHLNTAGVAIRTQSLIDRLLPYVNP